MFNDLNDFNMFDDFNCFDELSISFQELSNGFRKAVLSPSGLRTFAKNAPKLTKDQQLALGRIIQDSETNSRKREAAVEMLIISGLQLIFYHVRCCRDSDQREELIQTGLMGLTKAAQSYDPSRDILFTTYADNAVKSAIADFYRYANEPLHMSSEVYQDAKKIQKLEKEACDELGRGKSLTDREIAEKLKMAEKKVMCIRRAQRVGNQIIGSTLSDQDKSINSWEYSAYDSSTSQSVLGKSDAEAADSKRYITARVDEILAKEDALVVKMHFGLVGNQSLTVKEIAEILHHTPAQISYRLRVSRQQLCLDRGLRSFFELDD